MEDLSHDSVNRFLLRERYEPRDLFDEVKPYINLVDGKLSAKDALFLISLREFKELHSIHWGIECYHRAIKQVCGIELLMVRTSEAIKTHFFSAIRAFTRLELMRTQELIENWYEVQRNLSLQVARDFILEHLEQKIGLNTHSQIPVNS